MNKRRNKATSEAGRLQIEQREERQMNFRKLFLLGAAATMLGAVGVRVAGAGEYDDGMSVRYYEVLKGKKVAFVPISMGFDITEGWYAGMKRQADALGYEIIVRDPAWKTDVGAQALTQLIAEKPDLLIVHNPDMQVYARLIQKAQKAGIPVLQVNDKSTAVSDAFVGVDEYQLGVEQAKAMVKLCGKDAGKNGKIAIMQGVLTNPASAVTIQGVEDVLKEHPDISVVSNQSADWDASKAHAVATTVLKQNPDLCGYIGFWDVMDVGTAAAIKEAGKQGAVYLVTSGAGNETTACANLANNNFAVDVSYDVQEQARDINSVIKMLLQQPPNPVGSRPFALYTPIKVLTKETLRPGACWTLDDMKKYGG
jgi:ribose transport system substrate-binding protein